MYQVWRFPTSPLGRSLSEGCEPILSGLCISIEDASVLKLIPTNDMSPENIQSLVYTMSAFCLRFAACLGPRGFPGPDMLACYTSSYKCSPRSRRKGCVKDSTIRGQRVCKSPIRKTPAVDLGQLMLVAASQTLAWPCDGVPCMRQSFGSWKVSSHWRRGRFCW